MTYPPIPADIAAQPKFAGASFHSHLATRLLFPPLAPRTCAGEGVQAKSENRLGAARDLGSCGLAPRRSTQEEERVVAGHEGEHASLSGVPCHRRTVPCSVFHLPPPPVSWSILFPSPAQQGARWGARSHTKSAQTSQTAPAGCAVIGGSGVTVAGVERFSFSTALGEVKQKPSRSLLCE